MKLLQLTHGGDGLLSICNAYAKACQLAGYEVTTGYLFGPSSEEARRKTVAEHVNFFNFTKSQLKGVPFYASRMVAQLCRREEFRIIISHQYKATKVAALASLFCPPVRIMSAIHVLGDCHSWKRKLYLYSLNKKGVIVVCASEAVRQDLLRACRWLQADRFVTIRYGLNVEETVARQFDRERARALLKVSPDKFVFGTVGRLVWEKAHAHLIAALALVKDELPKAILLIIGEGPLRHQLYESARQMGVADRVRFAGEISEAARLMPAFDAFVLSSVSEGFALVLLEAMTARLPVISTAVGGTTEVVGRCGILVPPADPHTLASALRQVSQMTELERRDLGRIGYERVSSCFSMSRFCGNVRDLLHRSGKPPKTAGSSYDAPSVGSRS